MGSVSKFVNPVKAVKSTVNAIRGKKPQVQSAQVQSSAQYHEPVRGSEADVSNVGGLGSDLQASRPSGELTGLGGVSKEDLKLIKKKLLGG